MNAQFTRQVVAIREDFPNDGHGLPPTASVLPIPRPQEAWTLIQRSGLCWRGSGSTEGGHLETRLSAACATIVALALTLAPATAAQAAPQPSPSPASGAAASSGDPRVEDAASGYRDGDLASMESLADAASTVPAVPMSRTDDGLSAKTSNGIQVEVQDGEISLAKAGVPELGIAIEGNEGSVSRVVQGSLVESEVAPSVDAVTRATSDGVQLIFILANSTAQRTVDFELNVDGGVQMKDADGGLLLTTPNGKVVGGIAKPWARDAKGKDVPTRFVVNGQTVTQVVEPTEEAEYPIVADPYLFMDMIKSASWSKSSLGWTLKVTPTTAARAFGGAYLAGVAGWDELYSKYKNKGLDTNLDGMRDQYICHQQFAFFKDTWNLDEYRKNLSYVDTVAAGCNPPVKK